MSATLIYCLTRLVVDPPANAELTLLNSKKDGALIYLWI
jgi:hypothetical protein